jgi:hypothetical protein
MGNNFVVNNLNDSGEGSLRQAILDSNNSDKQNLITFSVEGIIKLCSRLPDIKTKTVINGITSQNYSGKPLIEINFHKHCGLNITADECAIIGLSLVNSFKYAIRITSSNCTIIKNWIGIDLCSNPKEIEGDGIIIEEDCENPKSCPNSNKIGENTDLDQFYFSNVISNCTLNGIKLLYAEDNIIINNIIGLDPTGNIEMPNKNGIFNKNSNGTLIGGAIYIDKNNVINDPTGAKGKITPTFVRPLHGNIISANREHGIFLFYSYNVNIKGNFVGTNNSGTIALGNKLNGIHLEKCEYISIIGCELYNEPFVYYNILSGNDGNGIQIHDSNYIIFQGNFCGINSTNNGPLGNGKNGILVSGTSNNVINGQVIPLGSGCGANKLSGVSIVDHASNILNINIFAGIFAFGGAAPNGKHGISITSDGTGNVIRTCVCSGNLGSGIYLGCNSNHVFIENIIAGCNTNVTDIIPNHKAGIHISDHSNNNTIGINVNSVIPITTISGNLEEGILLDGRSNNNTIANIHLGINIGGNVPFSNQRDGIRIADESYSNIIGQDNNINIISGNYGYGISLGPHTHSNIITWNWIGYSILLNRLPNLLGSFLNLSKKFSNTIFNNNAN